MNDSEWAKQIADGDETAKARFVMTYHASVYRWLRYLTASEEAAQELTQETFLEALKGIAKFESRAALSTWLHRIAYFRYTHWLRERKQQERWHTGLEAAEALPDPHTGQHWEALCLRQALGQLSEAHRDTFILHYVQQLSVPEVAEVLNVPPGTVQSRLFHARQKLREQLQDTLEPGAAKTNKEKPAPSPKLEPGDKNGVNEVIIR